MMARTRCKGEPSLPPLLVWRERHELDRLEQERLDLAMRVAALPRHSHRRIALQARLTVITHRILAGTTGAQRRPDETLQ